MLTQTNSTNETKGSRFLGKHADADHALANRIRKRISELNQHQLMNEWMPIDTMPIYKKVLIYTIQREIGFGEKDDSGCIGTAVTIHLGKPNTPTHWMELPAPPVNVA